MIQVELLNEEVRDVRNHLKREVGELKVEINHLKREVGELKAEINHLERDVSELKTRIKSVEERMEDFKLYNRYLRSAFDYVNIKGMGITAPPVHRVASNAAVIFTPKEEESLITRFSGGK